MAIITISRGSYSKGKEAAEKAAQKLGYECVAREILLEASDHFNIPEMKLVRALHDAPSIFQRFTYGKEKYLAYINAAFLEHMIRDNIVYHGLAGHFMLKGVSHVLKVRILSDIEDRTELEAKRENISVEEARHLLKKDDDERRRWSHALFGADPWDPNLYDLCIHIHKLSVEDAVDLICETAARPQFQKTEQSEARLLDLLVSARVKAALVREFPDVKTSSQNGQVHIQTNAPENLETQTAGRIEELASKVAGVKGLQVHVLPIAFD